MDLAEKTSMLILGVAKTILVMNARDITQGHLALTQILEKACTPIIDGAPHIITPKLIA